MNHCTSHIRPYGICLALGLYTSTLTSIVWAQNQTAIDSDFESKIIYIDQLGLPRSCSAEVVVRLLPELLDRPGDNITNYSIQVEDVPVGEAGDAALIQLHVDDIDRVEVTESPIASYQNNGQGGTIKIMLRRKPRQEGDTATWGKASLEALYPTDITPSVHLNHQGNKWLMRNFVMGEIYNPAEKRQETSQGKWNKEAAQDQKFWSQVACSMLEFQPTTKDKIELNLSEYASKDTKDVRVLHQAAEASAPTSNSTQKLTLQTTAKYQHSLTPQSLLIAKVSYRYAPSKDNNDVSDSRIERQMTNHNLSGNVEYEHQWKGHDRPWQIKLNTGITTNQDYGNDLMKENNLIRNAENELQSHISHQMIYAKVSGQYGRWGLMTAGEYQYYTYHVQALGEPRTTNTQKDYTAQAVASWQPAPQHKLQFEVNRKLKRPTNEQIYPVRIYNIGYLQYVQGNPELKPVLLHETTLSYLGHLRWGEHQLTLSADVSYNDVSDAINSCAVGGSDASDGMLGTTQKYLTFINQDHYRILNGGLMARYRYHNFSLSLIGNSSNAHVTIDNEHKKLSAFNLSLLPSVSLPDGFAASLCLTYNGEMESIYGTQGAITYATCNIGRDWGAWRTYLFLQASLSGQEETTSPAGVIVQADIVKTMGGVGMIYYF